MWASADHDGGVRVADFVVDSANAHGEPYIHG